MWSQILLGSFAVLATCAYLLLKSRKNKKQCQQNTTHPKSLLVVIGSGGHTREILCLVKVLGENYQPRSYLIAETDKMSEAKLLESEKGSNVEFNIFTIPRCREVKQSYFTSIMTTLRAVAYCVPLVFKLKPDIILCNGPGTCIPVCVAGLFLKWLQIQRTIVIYVESICRVKSLSLSGKFLYHFADSLFVQWPELKQKYPKSKYLGRLV